MAARGNTRAQIVEVAMRRFIEQGYDRTSLREIADELGVTKAALYYHFRTKDDIVRSAVSGYSERIAELAAWAVAEPAGQARDERLVDCLVELIGMDGGVVLRFAQVNPTVMAGTEFGSLQLDVLRALITAIAGPDPQPEGTLRASLVFAAVLLGITDTPLPMGDDRAVRAAAVRTVALDLLASLSA